MAPTVTLNGVFRCSLIIVGLLTAVFFYAFDHHRYFNELSLLLAELILLVQYLAAGRFSRRYPLAWMVNIVVLLMVSTRLLGLSYDETWIRVTPKIDADIFNQCLLFLLAGTISCYAGLGHGAALGGGLVGKSRRLPESVNFTTFASLFLIALTFCIVSYLGFGYWGQSGSGEHLNFFSRYVIRFFDVNVLMILFIVSFFFRKSPETTFQKRLFSLGLVGYLMCKTLLGSRSGLLELVLALVSGLLLFNPAPRFRLSPGRAVLAAVGLFALPLFFQVATQFRAATWYLGQEVSSIETVQTLFRMISERASLVDAALRPMFASELGYCDISEDVNLKTTVLSTINRYLPGKPLGKIQYSEFAYGYLFSSTGHVAYDSFERVDYNSYEWGMWGISYQLFGYFGGLIFIYLFMFALSGAVESLKRKGTFSSLSMAGLLSYEVSCWVRALGVDNFVDRVGHELLLMAIYLWVFRAGKLNPTHRLRPEFQLNTA